MRETHDIFIATSSLKLTHDLEDARFTVYQDEERRYELMLVHVGCKGNQRKTDKGQIKQSNGQISY